jgi:hypothetical protein
MPKPLICCGCFRYINKKKVAIEVTLGASMTANLLTHSKFACGQQAVVPQQNFDTIWISIRATQLLGGNGCIYQKKMSLNE